MKLAVIVKQFPSNTRKHLSSVACDVLNWEADNEVVTLVLGQLRAGKAAGRDGIVIEMFKHVPSLVLAALFRKCYQMGLIPNQWCVGIIVPLPKISTRDPLDPSQYRGIPLVSVIYKAFCIYIG